MVSFVCDYCQETLKKAKLRNHALRCRNAQFSCVDCYTTFSGNDYEKHTSCITEEQKFHGKLYKAKGGASGAPAPALNKVKATPPASPKTDLSSPKPLTLVATLPAKDTKKERKKESKAKREKKILNQEDAPASIADQINLKEGISVDPTPSVSSEPEKLSPLPVIIDSATLHKTLSKILTKSKSAISLQDALDKVAKKLGKKGIDNKTILASLLLSADQDSFKLTTIG